MEKEPGYPAKQPLLTMSLRLHPARLLLPIIPLCLLIFVYCGGGGGDGGGSGGGSHPPTISSFRYANNSPTSAYHNDGGGQITATGVIDFSDIGGDIQELNVIVFDSFGNITNNWSNPITGVSGYVTGIVLIPFQVQTSQTNNYTFQIKIKDSEGAFSNVLTGYFSVYIRTASNYPMDRGGTKQSKPSIAIIFSDNMDATTINANNFYLRDSFGTTIPCSVSYDIASRKAILIPYNDLILFESYRATITTGVRSVSGGEIQTNYEWSFVYADKLWDGPIQISSGGINNGFGVAAVSSGPNNDFIVVWSQYNGTYFTINSKKHSLSSGWENQIDVLSSPTGNAYNPKIAIDENSNAISVWSQVVGTQYKIFANRYINGVGWGTPTVISQGIGNASNPQISINSIGNAVVAWDQEGVGGISVWINNFTGGTWGTSTEIASGSSEYTLPKVSFDTFGNFMVVWQARYSGLNKNIYARYNNPNSGWEPETLISSGSDPTFSPNLARDISGNFMIIWGQETYPLKVVYARLFIPGSGWGSINIISNTNAANVATPVIAGEGNGNFIATWTESDSNGQYSDLYFNKFTLTSGWGSPSGVQGYGGNKYYPNIVMNNSGHAVVVWTNTLGAGAEVARVNRYIDGYGWVTSYITSVQVSPDGQFKSSGVAINEDGDAMAVSYGVNASMGIWVDILH